MTTAATSLLGLALPVTGELSGTWGDTVNNSITALLDSAVAGTTTLSADADVTLTTTTLAANQAREAIILWTAGGTVTRNITAPAQSKTYVVLNKTSSTQSIVIRGVGPTTGVTVLAGKQAMVAWDGADFVEVSSGYVDGPASSTDNAVARFDGTDGKTIQNSVVIIADTTGNMSGVGTLGVGAITTTGALVGAASQDAFNTVSTTLNLGGAATTVNIGAATGTLTVANATLAAKAVTATSVTNSALTATRVLYAGTAGLIQDSANMTFNGTVLTSSFAGPVAATTLSASSTVSGTGFSTYLASPPAIGGTAAAAGAFTTLSASSTVSGTGFSTYLASPPAIGGTAAAAGAFTTLSASSTVSGTGFSTYLASPPAIGGTAAAAGAFTTLSASSTVSGTGFSTYLASPPAIGGTAAAAGSFTTLTTSSTITLSTGTANGVAYLNGSKVLTTGSALTFDGTSLGVSRINLGGTTATGTNTGELYLPNSAAIRWRNAAGSGYLNAIYVDGSNNLQLGGGGATNSIIFSAVGAVERMRLDVSGVLLIGQTATKTNEYLRVSNTGQASMLLDNTGKTNGAFVGVFNDSALFGINRNPSTGVFYNTSNYAADIVLVGNSSTSYISFETTAAANTIPTERARIDSSGNLGIGTTSPATKLDVNGGITATTVKSGSGSVATTTAVASTLFTSTTGLYQVYAYIAFSGGPAQYTASATVMNDGNGARVVANNGANLIITLSGLIVQITQTSGTNQTVTYSFLKIA